MTITIKFNFSKQSTMSTRSYKKIYMYKKKYAKYLFNELFFFCRRRRLGLTQVWFLYSLYIININIYCI